MGEIPNGATPKAATTSRYAWYVVAMLWCISFFNYADRQAVFSVFELLRVEMSLTDSQLGWVGSSFSWVYGLCSPLAGNIVDRVRRKSAILVGLQVWSAICIATAMSRNYLHLLFFRAAEGLGESCYYPAATSMLSDYHGPATRSRALGLHQTSVYIGSIAGGWFSGVIAQHFGWRWSFVVFGALGMGLGLVLYQYLREPIRGSMETAPATSLHKPNAGDIVRVILSTPTVLFLMLAFLCANFVAMVLLTWMPSYLSREFGMSLAMSGLTATIYVQLASLVGAVLGGWLGDWGRRYTFGGRILVQFVGVLGGAPFVFLCGQTTSVGVLALALTAWGLFKGLYDANIFAAVFDVVRPEYRGTVAGSMNLVGWLGGGAPAPVIIGYLAESHTLGWAISSAAIVYVAASAFLLTAALGFVRRDAVRLSR